MSNQKPIEDVGEYIPFARKDAHQPSEEATSTGSPSEVTLKNLWPEPDWDALFFSGVARDALAMIYALYHSMAKRPAVSVDGWHFAGESITSSMWENAYVEVVNFIKEGCESASVAEDITALKSEFGDLYNGSYKKCAAGKLNSKRWRSSIGLEGFNKYFPKLLPMLGWPLNVNAKKIPCVPVKVKHNKTKEECYLLAIPQKAGSIRYKTSGLPYENHFTSYDDAVDALIRHHGEVFLRKPAKNDPYIPRKDYALTEQHQNVPRRDVHQLMKDFDFRGIQFGNWVPQAERQQFIDNTHHALTLLAGILNIPTPWIGNKLGLAFAARGRGSASAHYERWIHAVNLTRFSGPGCIAHEFFHSFDGRMALRWTGSKRYLMSEIVVQYGPDAEEVIDEINQARYHAFKRIVEACVQPSEFTRNAARLSAQKRGPKYWDTEIELCARAFEAYVQDVVIANGDNPAWLAIGTLESDYPANGMHPYPTGEDRVRIGKVMRENLPVLFQR